MISISFFCLLSAFLAFFFFLAREASTLVACLAAPVAPFER
jgi:hypothetical protein